MGARGRNETAVLQRLIEDTPEQDYYTEFRKADLVCPSAGVLCETKGSGKIYANKAQKQIEGYIAKVSSMGLMAGTWFGIITDGDIHFVRQFETGVPRGPWYEVDSIVQYFEPRLTVDWERWDDLAWDYKRYQKEKAKTERGRELQRARSRRYYWKNLEKERARVREYQCSEDGRRTRRERERWRYGNDPEFRERKIAQAKKTYLKKKQRSAVQ